MHVLVFPDTWKEKKKFPQTTKYYQNQIVYCDILEKLRIGFLISQLFWLILTIVFQTFLSIQSKFLQVIWLESLNIEISFSGELAFS